MNNPCQLRWDTLKRYGLSIDAILVMRRDTVNWCYSGETNMEIFGLFCQKQSKRKSREKFRWGRERRRAKKKKKEKRKGEVEKDVRVRGKKKERKVLFGSVCGSHKTVEIIEWCEVKIVAKRVGIRKLWYFKWWMISDEWWVMKIEWGVMSD